MWVLSRPAVRVRRRRVGATRLAACPAVIPELVADACGRSAWLAVGRSAAVVLVALAVLDLQRAARRARSRLGSRRGPIGRRGVGRSALPASRAPARDAVPHLDNIPVEPIALLVAVPLGYLAAQVLATRDARRFVGGLVIAIVGWFVVFYPNISALPLPSAVVNAYQGLLPTYLYAFQFPVSTAPDAPRRRCCSPTLAS